MFIKSISIKNYKCFFDTGIIEFQEGFNFIVGKNDSGKSALLDALRPTNPLNQPHKSLSTIPYIGSVPSPNVEIKTQYEFTSEEIKFYFSSKSSVFVYSEPQIVDPISQKFIATLEKNKLILNVVWSENSMQHMSSVPGWFEGLPSDSKSYMAQLQNDEFPHSCKLRLTGTTSADHQDYGNQLARYANDKTYAFKAERLNISSSAIRGELTLYNNASNLPDVLNQLSTRNIARYNRLITHVKTIFPHIDNIRSSVLPGGSNTQIYVWQVATETERDDLSILLSESGTGIGQVLALLYVVVTSDSPTSIIIDEPQSFLHPGAVRKLMEILRSYPQHQYIITTHSPIMMDGDENDNILLVKRNGSYSSDVIKLDSSNQESLTIFLNEVGARLSDVFGVDQILWVEGKTEELCFPIIIKKLAQIPLKGTEILGVISTDELTLKHANRVLQIYQRLSETNSLLPPALAFIFDKEKKTQSEMDDLNRSSGDLIKWLPVRLYENFLINFEAISTVLNEEDSERSKDYDADFIEQAFNTISQDNKYHLHAAHTAFTPDWYNTFDGAKLLNDLFHSLTAGRVAYNKVSHGQKLTNILCDKQDPKMKELSDWLESILSTR